MTLTNERITVSTLIRLSGLASIAAGLLWSIGTIANFVIGGSIEPANTAAATVALLTHVVMVFAFLSIYAGQAHRMGVVGTLGTVKQVDSEVIRRIHDDRHD